MRTQAWRTGSSGSGAVGAQPHPLLRPLGPAALGGHGVDVAGVDRAGPLVPLAEALAVGRHAAGEVGQRPRAGDAARHGDLMVEPRLGAVEAGLQVEDRPAVLDGHHPPGGEALAVTDAIDLVEDRYGRIAGAEEVGMERVHGSARVVDRPGGRHQRLPGHLASEHPLPVLVGGQAAEDVDLDDLQVEQPDQLLERARAAPGTAARGHRRHVDTSLTTAGGRCPRPDRRATAPIPRSPTPS